MIGGEWVRGPHANPPFTLTPYIAPRPARSYLADNDAQPCGAGSLLSSASSRHPLWLTNMGLARLLGLCALAPVAAGAQPPPDAAQRPPPPYSTAPHIFYNVFFDTGSSRIDRIDAVILDNVVAGVVEAGGGLLIEGHADRVGPRQANYRLSCARARAVRDYVLARGVQPSRIRLHAYGEDRPKRETPDEVADPINRAVDLMQVLPPQEVRALEDSTGPDDC